MSPSRPRLRSSRSPGPRLRLRPGTSARRFAAATPPRSLPQVRCPPCPWQPPHAARPPAVARPATPSLRWYRTAGSRSPPSASRAPEPSLASHCCAPKRSPNSPRHPPAATPSCGRVPWPRHPASWRRALRMHLRPWPPATAAPTRRCGRSTSSASPRPPRPRPAPWPPSPPCARAWRRRRHRPPLAPGRPPAPARPPARRRPTPPPPRAPHLRPRRPRP
mmetsp:Transcript_26654/g.76803  ORF Transcript_26654/g.76803 Transcript_26654/m.76803 type:complete len:220 (-) Transcript_26654:54-713(-)